MIPNPHLMRLEAALAQEGVSLQELMLHKNTILLYYICVIDVLLKVENGIPYFS